MMQFSIRHMRFGNTKDAIIQYFLENMTENFSLKALVGLSDVISYN